MAASRYTLPLASRWVRALVRAYAKSISRSVLTRALGFAAHREVFDGFFALFVAAIVPVGVHHGVKLSRHGG